MRIAICDDDGVFAQHVAECIQGGKAEAVSVFSASAELLSCIAAGERFAAVLMDIDLCGENGIDAAREVTRLDGNVKIIFLTSYSKQYCEEIFFRSLSVTPFALIDKANYSVNLVKAIDKLANELSVSRLNVKTKGHTVSVEPSKILCVESCARLLRLRMEGGEEYTYYEKLADLLEKLPPYFCRCHKSYAVNARQVVSYSAAQAELSGGIVIPVSRSYSREFRENMLLIKGEGL